MRLYPRQLSKNIEIAVLYLRLESQDFNVDITRNGAMRYASSRACNPT